jgi:signal peptidase I
MSDRSQPPPLPESRDTRWVGAFLSVLLTGSGLFFTGRRREGLLWFAGGSLAFVMVLAVLSLPTVDALYAAMGVWLCWLGLWGFMIRRSLQPVQLTLKRLLLVILLVLSFEVSRFLIFSFCYRVTRLPNGAMEPTIYGPTSKGKRDADDILANRLLYRFTQPKRGDIIIFHATGLPGVPQNTDYLKRIVGLPGEELEIREGTILVNGRELPKISSAHFPPRIISIRDPMEINHLRVPEDSYFVIGDNTARSYDSRGFGCVKRENILGKVTHIYWSRFGVRAVQ